AETGHAVAFSRHEQTISHRHEVAQTARFGFTSKPPRGGFMYKLYNVKSWGSLAPHFVLEELGVPYQNIWMTAEQVRDPKFREISPLGFVPVLGLPDGRAVVESAAIVVFLTDAYPDRKLAPAPGEDEHAVYLSWLVFMSVNLYQMISIHFAPSM